MAAAVSVTLVPAAVSGSSGRENSGDNIVLSQKTPPATGADAATLLVDVENSAAEAGVAAADVTGPGTLWLFDKSGSLNNIKIYIISYLSPDHTGI
jgi:hypothetical protein